MSCLIFAHRTRRNPGEVERNLAEISDSRTPESEYWRGFPACSVVGLLIRRSLVRAQVGEPIKSQHNHALQRCKAVFVPGKILEASSIRCSLTRQHHARTPASPAEKQRGAARPRPGSATDGSGVRTQRIAPVPRASNNDFLPTLRDPPASSGAISSLAGAGAAAHDEPALRACNPAVMQAATDKRRPLLLPVLRSFNCRVEGRHEETHLHRHRHRHQVREGSVGANH